MRLMMSEMFVSVSVPVRLSLIKGTKLMATYQRNSLVPQIYSLSGLKSTKDSKSTKDLFSTHSWGTKLCGMFRTPNTLGPKNRTQRPDLQNTVLEMLTHTEKLRMISKRNMLLALMIADWNSSIMEEEKGKKGGKRLRLRYNRGNPYESTWWRQWEDKRSEVVDGQPEGREAKSWRRRFLVPKQLFRRILARVREEGDFPERFNEDGLAIDNHRTKNIVCPLELKLMGFLRVLGRGYCFDGIGELANTEEEIHRKFFHKFATKFSEYFWDEWVYMPRNVEELDEVTKVYEKLGYPGCAGSTDCTHVWWNMCPAGQRALHKGKESYPSLSYSLAVNHNCRILSATKGFPGATNDKTIVKFDPAIYRLQSDNLFTDYAYNLNIYGDEFHRVTGAYFICDGGMLQWRVLQSTRPKSEVRPDFVAWSHMTESVRKDAECVNGRLKKRFRFFKAPIEIHNKDTIDSAFFSACILHNMLLEDMGLDKYLAEEDIWMDADAEDDHNLQGDEAAFARAPGYAERVERINKAAARGGGGVPQEMYAEAVAALYGEEGEQDYAFGNQGFHLLQQQLCAHFTNQWNKHLVQWPERYRKRARGVDWH